MKIGDLVEYAKPFEDEKGLTFTVVEIEEATNWCKIRANVGLTLCPTYVANITDLQIINNLKL